MRYYLLTNCGVNGDDECTHASGPSPPMSRCSFRLATWSSTSLSRAPALWNWSGWASISAMAAATTDQLQALANVVSQLQNQMAETKARADQDKAEHERKIEEMKREQEETLKDAKQSSVMRCVAAFSGSRTGGSAR